MKRIFLILPTIVGLLILIVCFNFVAGQTNRKESKAPQAKDKSLKGKPGQTANPVVLTDIDVRSGKVAMTPELLMSLSRISDLHLSPDGNWAVYRLSTPNIGDNKLYSDLYAVFVDGKKTVQLTDDKASDYNPVWSPDSKKIGFISTRDGRGYSPKAYIMDFPNGKPKMVIDMPNGVSNLAWSPDGKWLSFSSDVQVEQTVKEKYPSLDKAKVRIYKKLPIRHWDEWEDENLEHVFVVPAAGGEPKDLIKSKTQESPVKVSGGAEDIAWSPDGKEIAFVTKSTINYVLNTKTNIYLADVQTGEQKLITKRLDGYCSSPLYSPDSNWIAFLSLKRNGYESDKSRIMLYNRRTGALDELTKSFDQWASQLLWSPDSKSLYFAAPDSGVVSIFSIQVPEGNWKRITNGFFDYDRGIGITPDGKTIVAGRHSMTMPVDIYTMPATGGTPTQITNVNRMRFEDINESKVEQRWITSKDGSKVHCWVVYPPGFDPTKKYPMITFCQGGPQSMVSPNFHYRWNLFMIASQGYVVLAPNRRGAPGFGQAWVEAISRDWGGGAMQDILSATDELASQPYVDKDHLAAMGASAGGYAAFWLEGNNGGRFKCLVSHCGVFNFESMYGATEELWFPNWEFGGSYWDPATKEIYQKSSPNRFVQNWNVPIFISTGEHDFRVPFTQSLEAFTAAQLRNLPSELVIFPEETHFVSHPQEFIIWYKEMFEFLDRYCKSN